MVCLCFIRNLLGLSGNKSVFLSVINYNRKKMNHKRVKRGKIYRKRQKKYFILPASILLFETRAGRGRKIF